jgi:carboxyl-terminal processing protease
MLARRAPRFGPVLLVLLLLGSPRPARAALSCADVPELAGYFLQKHILYHQMTDELKQRAVETYVRRLDPQRSLFLQPEVDRLETNLLRVFSEMREGKCDRLAEVQRELISRSKEAADFIDGFVDAKDFKLDPNAKLVIDPDQRGWPKTMEERSELLRTLADFQISNYLSSGDKLDEARKRLIHRYELRTKYAEDAKPDDLYSDFLDSIAASLDPHSSYLSADVLEDFQIQMQLSLEGIGVALSERDGYAVVEQVIPGGAADRLGLLRPKDRIIAVAEDGKKPVDIIDMPLRDVVRLIRGKKGTKVQLTILRQGEKTQRFQAVIVRDKIDLKEQAAKLRFEDVKAGGRNLKLAVLDLPSFYGDRDPSKRQGSRDVKRLLAQVKEQHADGLLLDLSRNGGGLLEDAVAISGFFIQKGGVVAVREDDQRRRVLEDPDDGMLYDGPMVVLTSRLSASASEILAGALQDYRRAVIVGDDHTFGKGTVQSVFPLRPGLGALKVTTGFFFRPGGQSTQLVGVKSNVEVPSLLEADDFGEKTLPYALPPQSIEPFASDDADGSKPGDHYVPVTAQQIAKLSKLAEARIAKSKTFKDIETEVAQRRADGGVMKLSELMARRDDHGNDDGTAPGGSPEGLTASAGTPHAGPPGAKAEAKDSPELKEALQVLADLVLLDS